MTCSKVRGQPNTSQNSGDLMFVERYYGLNGDHGLQAMPTGGALIHEILDRSADGVRGAVI